MNRTLVTEALASNMLSSQMKALLQELLTVKTGILPEKTPYLQLISGGENVTVAACEGKRTMNTMEKIFPGNIDGDFGNFGLNKPQYATDATPVSVYEVIRDGKLATLLISLNVGLKSLSMTRDQIITFCEKNANWLHPNSNSTLFLTEENDEFFFVGVWSDASHRRVHVY